MSAIPKQYNAGKYEEAIYKKWEDRKAFGADNQSDKKTYAISMPPPNATGELHVGHALFLTIQDILIRYARMQGRETLWLPGTDHAAIATESVVIRKLQQEGINNPRVDLGRQELVQKIADYVEQSRSTIRSQIRKMGASCDWSRERYTLEPALNKIVTKVFKKMYEDGLIYRGLRSVNWDPNLQTTVSDDEVEHVEEKTPFYTLRYGPFAIGTARPETKFGDKYVVVHPDDKRYKKFTSGDTFEADWINGPVTATIIKDEVIDPAFGTGAMTITPWHDVVDFDLAERHHLDKEQIINQAGKLLPVAEEFVGQTIEEARPKIVAKLEEKGLLIDVDENYIHSVAVNTRGKGKIEPQIMRQWFIDVNKPKVAWQGKAMSLKEVMQSVINSGDIQIYPQRFNKTYFHWIDNLRDWCISRQIWWGHRIPVWCRAQEVYVGEEPPEGSEDGAIKAGWEQDSDTLDTWFSSALWTWSTLIDPDLLEEKDVSLEELLKHSPDFQKFHPTTVMETGYDILFFWVARMILMTTYVTGQVPFKNVFLHGLITTPHGKKMSKSDPDSMVDPLQTIAEYGADATRFGLAYQMSYSSQVIKFDIEAVRSARNFANKIWNLARLLQSLNTIQKEATAEQSVADRWIQQRLNTVTGQVSDLLGKYKLGEAAHVLYDFIWSDYADWYMEIIKSGGSTKIARQVFISIQELLHPFMPHLTEVLWEKFEQTDLLINHPWPKVKAIKPDEEVVNEMNRFQDIVNSIRSARALFQIPPGTTIDIAIPDPPMPEAINTLCRGRLAAGKKMGMVSYPLAGGGKVLIGAPEISVASIAKAREKLDKQAKKLQEMITSQENILSDMKRHAPKNVVATKEMAINKAKQQLSHVRQSKASL